MVMKQNNQDTGDWHNWHKESIFWELPYWTDLNLRHNLDVMHIEKNFFDNIVTTVMNVKDRSKDTVKSRLDVALFCDRKELHVDNRGKAPFPIFRLTPPAKELLLECLKNDVKFPDGYASDLASCADVEGGKFSGMKSHDCHVFMEQLLPFIFAELLPKPVHLALSARRTKLRKFGRARRSSRRPKVTILIWKDRYLSHASRRSGMKPFGSTMRPRLIFYRDMSGKRVNEAHGGFGVSNGPSSSAKGLDRIEKRPG
ncbi:unnamed protein product [Microthlaspi erraticum]|uniref:Uncharacterized protein n=1 Tax=Microthlaspi erraticum TaxID=1685480 RepID=A0A6D2KR51_9BRAS|nr:unnamed protein product [Microthlaspi erraticum]